MDGKDTVRFWFFDGTKRIGGYSQQMLRCYQELLYNEVSSQANHVSTVL
jgi:hypothetical protein